MTQGHAEIAPMPPKVAEASTESRAKSWGWFELALASVGGLGLIFAFVGLGKSSYFVDELFTIYLINHSGGVGEVLRRVFSDTGPPLYYFGLYIWSKLAGLSEIALRLPSAICAAAAIGVAAVGLRGVLSLRARLFLIAMAVTGKFWFIQSQNARGYALGMLISAGLLVFAVTLRARARDDRSVWPQWTALTMLAIAGCLVHFYLFLEAGFILTFLILTTGGVRLKAALVGSGALCALATAACVRLMLANTTEDIHHMWFRTDIKFFLIQLGAAVRGLCGIPALLILAVIAAIWLVHRLRSGRDAAASSTAPDPAAAVWTAQLAVFVLAGMTLAGIVISVVVAPSLSDANLLLAAPLAWAFFAAMFDLANLDVASPLAKLGALAIAGLLGVTAIQYAAGRFLPRIEEWRASARYIDGIPACKGQPIPVVALQLFGPSTPHYLALAEHDFYGHYETAPARLHAVTPSAYGGRDLVTSSAGDSDAAPTAAELSKADPQLSALVGQRLTLKSACPVLGWAAHDFDPTNMANLQLAIAASEHVAPGDVVVKPFYNYKLGILNWHKDPEAFVILARRS